MIDPRLRATLADYARRLHARGWVANHDGNVTARLAGAEDRFLATPTATSKAEVSADSLKGLAYQQRLVTKADGDTEIDEMATHVSVPLADISTMEERRRSWKAATRWGIGVAAASAFVVAVGAHIGNRDNAQPGGGKGPPLDL